MADATEDIQEEESAVADAGNEGDAHGASGAGGALALAVGRYRELVASQPGLVPEIVQGNTIEEIDASAELARQSFNEISKRLTEQYERQVPRGNPARSGNDAMYEGLKPEAKIALGLRRTS